MTYRVLHVPQTRKSTGVEGDVLGGSKKGRLQNEGIGVFGKWFEVVVFGQKFRFGRNGEGQVKIGADLTFDSGDEVVYVFFGVQLEPVDLQTVHFAGLEKIDQPL